MKSRRIISYIPRIIFIVFFIFIIPTTTLAQPGAMDTSGSDSSASSNSSIPLPKLSLTMEDTDNPQEVGTAFSTLILLTILSLAPSIIILFTSFIRIAIVFSFARTALSTQQVPPNQVLYGLALILTFFIMSPIFQQIYDNAYVPFQEGEMNIEEFGERAMEPIREFMYKQMGSDSAKRSLRMFIKLGNIPKPSTPEDIPLHVLVPAFVINELTTAFTIGIMIFIPFIIIDLVVSSVLLSIGIIFLPPVIVSLPIKITLFVLVDGWNFLVEGLIKSFL